MTPMQRELYPPNWEAIAYAVKDAAGWKCQRCGRQCRRPGDPFDCQQNTLTVAHLDDPDPMCVEPGNLMAMCAPCHLRYDAQMHARRARDTRRGIVGGAKLPGVEEWPR
jgi:hypothetical protein